MNDWKEVLLKDYCKTQYGYTASATDNNTGVKFVRITDIVPDFVDWNKVPYCEISEKDFKKYKLNEGDIVAARTGATVGYAKQIRKGSPDAVFASYLVKLIPSEKVDKHFLGVLIESNVYREFIQIIAGGSAQPNANANDLTLFKFFLPPLPTQQRIASILSAYDDLIEVNNQRIKLLEETTRELYKEWFVRMRFPGYKKAKFVKGVPEGWEVKKIGDVCKVARGSSPRPIVDTRYFENGTIPWVKIADASASGKFLFETKEYVNEFGASFSRLLKPGSLIIATSGTLGFCIFLAIEACIHDGWMYTTDYKYSVTPEFLFFIINDRTEYFNNLSYGAAIQNINTDILRKAPFLLPNKDLLEKFQGMIVPINEHQKNLQQQNTQLRQIRDRLLPRLISGKLCATL